MEKGLKILLDLYGSVTRGEKLGPKVTYGEDGEVEYLFGSYFDKEVNARRAWMFKNQDFDGESIYRVLDGTLSDAGDKKSFSGHIYLMEFEEPVKDEEKLFKELRNEETNEYVGNHPILLGIDQMLENGIPISFKASSTKELKKIYARKF